MKRVEPAFMSVYNTQSLFRLDLPYRALAHRSFGKYDAGFYFDTLHTLLPDNVDDSFDERTVLFLNIFER